MKYLIYGFLVIVMALSTSCGEKKYYAVFETEFGEMKAELYNSTPGHRDNFIKLANEDFYDGLLFHRVMSGFMIQGGDPQSKNAAPGQRLGMGGPGYQIDAEIGAPHFRGTLAAARTGGPGNPLKRSSGSQFYIVQGTPQTRSVLQTIGQQKGIAYSEAHLTKYVEIGGAPMLDMEYTVFGELVSGWEVIDKIAAVPTDQADRPLNDVRITAVRITTK